MFDHDTAADPLITYDQQVSTKLDEVMNIYFPLKVVKLIDINTRNANG